MELGEIIKKVEQHNCRIFLFDQDVGEITLSSYNEDSSCLRITFYKTELCESRSMEVHDSGILCRWERDEHISREYKWSPVLFNVVNPHSMFNPSVWLRIVNKIFRMEPIPK